MSQTQRRQFLIAAGLALLAPRVASPQSTGRPPRVGLLFGSTREGVASEMDSFSSRLRELGYVPGKTVEIVPRFADGVPGRIPELARQLIDENVQVVFVPNTQGALALQQLSNRVAIIFVVGDPVAAGLVSSLARPGRNATGFTPGPITIAAKRVELLKDAFPSIRRLGVLHDSKFPIQQELRVIADAAAKLGIELTPGEASSRDQYFDAVARLREAGADGYDVVYTGSSFAIRRELAGVIQGTRLPAIYGVSRFADDGGLIAYSWRTLNVSVLAAEYADRILRGTSPADLSVQEPTLIELVVNLATAREQRLTIPPSILRRADRVIE